MKFLRFAVMDVAKAADVSQASDKTWASPPPGAKLLAQYACLGIAFPGQPANKIVSIAILEADSDEVLTATTYPVALAGADLWNVPVIEVPAGGAAAVEKKMRR